MAGTWSAEKGVSGHAKLHTGYKLPSLYPSVYIEVHPATGPRGRSMKICSNRLTTCRVTADGETLELCLEDRSDTAVSLQIPFDQAEAIAMTLPHLLTQAVRRRTGQDEA